MRYIVTGCDSQLSGRVVENMLNEVSGDQLIFTCPDLTKLSKEKNESWQHRGVLVRQANYDN